MGRFRLAAETGHLIGADGFSRLDVRTQLVTDDGAFIYVYYTGLLDAADQAH